VGVPAGPAPGLLARAAEQAERLSVPLRAVHVVRPSPVAAQLITARAEVEALGGAWSTVPGDDVVASLLAAAAAAHAVVLVVGGRWRSSSVGGVAGRLLAAGGAPVLVVPTAVGGRTPSGRLERGVSPGRRAGGAALAALLLPLVTLGCAALRSRLDLGGDLLVYLAAVLAVAVVGGFAPGLVAAVGSSLLLTYYFTVPHHTWSVGRPEDVLALAVFTLVALLVSRAVDVAGRRAAEAARAGAEARTLSTLAGDVLRGESALAALLSRTLEAFGAAGVALLEPAEGGWRTLATAGPAPPLTPAAAVSAPVDERRMLALAAPASGLGGPALLGAVAAQVAVALRQAELTAAAAGAERVAAADRARSALLSAAGHDLRTPLATATAAVSSLAETDVELPPAVRAELVTTAGTALDRLRALVDDLLDASRLQAGVLAAVLRPVEPAVAVRRAVASLGGGGVQVCLPVALPAVAADPGLLERVLANLLQNALRHAAAGGPPRLTGATTGGRVELSVIDHGPGVPVPERERVFQPFAGRSDRDPSSGGIGLGLSVARGLAEAMGASVVLTTTPGGGLTAVLSLAVAAVPADDAEPVLSA